MATASKTVKRYVPVDLLFSQDNITSVDGLYSGDLSIWQDVPVVNLQPYLAGLRAVCFGQGTIDDYLEFERKRSHPRDVKPSRIESAIRRQSSFWQRIFPRQLPVISRLERDRLILDDGNLAACLAKLRNLEWIDVLMPEEVAFKWDSRSTDEIDRAIASQPQRKGFYTPIMHEKYRRARVARGGAARLDLIRSFLGPVHRRLSLLDVGCNTGFYTYHFYRQGFEAVGIDMSESHLAIARAQRSTYSADVRFEHCNFRDIEMDRQYDIVLGLTVFGHILGWAKMSPSMTPQELGQKLEAVVGHALIWEGARQGDREKEVIQRYSGLAHYTKLGTTSGTGVALREFGVFTRQPVADTLATLRRLNSASSIASV